MHLLTFKKGLLYGLFFTPCLVYLPAPLAYAKKLQFVNHETCQFFNPTTSARQKSPEKWPARLSQSHRGEQRPEYSA
jgi:hypothetical protein